MHRRNNQQLLVASTNEYGRRTGFAFNNISVNGFTWQLRIRLFDFDMFMDGAVKVWRSTLFLKKKRKFKRAQVLNEPALTALAFDIVSILLDLVFPVVAPGRTGP